MVINEAMGEQLQHAIAPQAADDIQPCSMACASETGQPLKIQFNIPLKSQIKMLHDLVTSLEIQQAMVEQTQVDEAGDHESTT